MNSRIKTLNHLLKIAKKRVNERQCTISFIRSRITQCEEELSKMQQELDYEQAVSFSTSQCVSYFTNFHQHLHKRQCFMNDEIEKLNATLTKELDLIKEDFIEQKRYEYLLDKLSNIAKKTQQKIENTEIDEIGRYMSMRTKLTPQVTAS